MSDYLVRSIAKEAGVRIYACQITETVQEAAKRHSTTPTATVATGRALVAATLAGSLLKVKHRIALKFDGDGPLGRIIAESDSYGRVRAYVQNPKVEVERKNGAIDVASAVGSGVLIAVKDVKLRDLFEGVVALDSAEIGPDFELYLNQSEQIPSVIQLDVQLDDDGEVVTAGGILIQAFGDLDNRPVQELAEKLNEMPPYVAMIASGQTPQDIMAQLYGDIEYLVLEEREVKFTCSCSWERSEAALGMLSKEELDSMIEQGEATVDCNFCHQGYLFSAENLVNIRDSQA